MSKHHTLPPIIYTPPPKPKKIEAKRRSVVSMLDDLEDAREMGDAGQPAPITNRFLPQNFPEIEGAERKPQQPRGRLSEGTLKAMLDAQETNS